MKAGKANAARIMVAGLIPAILAVVPFVSIIVPLFATSYFTHVFKQVMRSSP